MELFIAVVGGVIGSIATNIITYYKERKNKLYDEKKNAYIHFLETSLRNKDPNFLALAKIGVFASHGVMQELDSWIKDDNKDATTLLLAIRNDLGIK